MENVMNIEKVNKCCVDRVKELYNYAKNNDRIEQSIDAQSPSSSGRG